MGGDQKSGRSVSDGRVHRRTNRPGPYVPSSACREARESPNDPSPYCGGNQRRGRRIHRCACRYGAAAGTRWRADHCGAVTPAGLTDPARASAGGADVVECAEYPRDGSDEPDREAVQSRQTPPEWSAETEVGRRKRLAQGAVFVCAGWQTSQGCAGRDATDRVSKRQDDLRRDRSGSDALHHDTGGLSPERGRQ